MKALCVNVGNDILLVGATKPSMVWYMPLDIRKDIYHSNKHSIGQI